MKRTGSLAHHSCLSPLCLGRINIRSRLWSDEPSIVLWDDDQGKRYLLVFCLAKKLFYREDYIFSSFPHLMNWSPFDNDEENVDFARIQI